MAVPGEFYGLFDLADDFIIPQDLGVDAGGYLEEVFDGGQSFLYIG